MGNRYHSYRLGSGLARILAFIIFTLGSFGLATAQTRIISLSGDMDFGRIPFGTSAQRTLTISNAGDSVLTVSNLLFPPVPALDQSSFQANWSGTIPPGGSRDVVITFTPRLSLVVGSNDLDFEGYLSIDSDATSGPNFIWLTGVGTWPPLPPGPNLDLGTATLGYSAGLNLTLTNIGTAPVTVSNVFVPSGFLSGFSGTIDPGAAATFSVIFNPAAVTNYLGLASVSSDATDPVLVLLTPKGNVTNSPTGFNAFSVSGTGLYPTGKFAGLFIATNNPTFENCGYFTATATAKGSFRAILTLAGKRYPFSAQVSPAGAVSATIRRKNLPALNVSLKYFGEVLRIGTDVNGPWMGTVDDGTWTAKLVAQNAPILSGHGRLPYAPDQYTVSIAGSTNAAVAPTAPGNATMTVNPIDGIHVAGTLGDGTRYSQIAILNLSHLPVYVPLYGKKGAILGWINFRYIFPPPPALVPNAINYQISGTLNWFKPAGLDPNYPDGFSFQTAVTGSVP